MKQQLWLLNSSLAAIFLGGLGANFLLRVELPIVVIPSKVAAQDHVKKEPLATTPAMWEDIYKNDLFGTYVAPMTPAPVQQNLVTPVPEMKNAAIEAVPEIKLQELIPPLVLTIKGIIIGANEAKNIAMIEDEAKKESLYYLGDKFKDALILKIVRNRVIFLRSNGQQETFYLRKADDINNESHLPERWQYIIKKNDETSFEIDPDNFKQEVPSLGNLIDRVNIIGAAYKQGAPVGIKIGDVAKGELGELLGFKQGDIVMSINGISTAPRRNRLTIYDAVVASKINDVISVTVKRDNVDVQISYKLVKISRVKNYIFAEEKKAPVDPETLKMNTMQEREAQMRDFNNQHPNAQHQDAIAQLRKRLLDNLRARLQNSQAS